MKKIALLSLLTTLALLSGCDSSSGSDSSSDVTGSTNSSNNTTPSGGSNSSDPTQNGVTKSITVVSVDDIKGYTFTTNTATIGSGDFTVKQSITLSVDCSGNFTYTETTGSDTKAAKGSFVDISMDSIQVVGNYVTGDSIDEYLYKIVNDTLTASETQGSCFYGYASDTQKGPSCPNNLYLSSIVQDEVCN